MLFNLFVINTRSGFPRCNVGAVIRDLPTIIRGNHLSELLV